QRFGEEHGERVRLFPGGAAGAPDADRVVRPLVGNDPRDDVLGKEVPRGRIPEEGRDVDEDGVEKVWELVRVDFEVVGVGGEAFDAQNLHAAEDAAHQTRALVGAEVEAAGPLEVIQQRVEGAVLGVVVHGGAQGKGRLLL